MKKTRAYYKELLDLGYTKGKRLSKEEKQLFFRQQETGAASDNIVFGADASGDLYEVEDIDAEEFMKKSNFLTIRNLRAIKRCLIFIVVLLAIGIAVGLIAGISALSQPDPVTIGTNLR